MLLLVKYVNALLHFGKIKLSWIINSEKGTNVYWNIVTHCVYSCKYQSTGFYLFS